MNFIDELTKERDNLAKDLARCYEELQATQKEVKLLERALYRTQKQRNIWKRVADRYIKKCEEVEERERDNRRVKSDGNRSIIDWGIKRVKHRDDEFAQKAPYIFGCDMSVEYRSQEIPTSTTDALCNDSLMSTSLRYFLNLQNEKDVVEDKAEPKWDVLRDYTGTPITVSTLSYIRADAICDIVDRLKGQDVCTDRAHCPYRDIFNS